VKLRKTEFAHSRARGGRLQAVAATIDAADRLVLVRLSPDQARDVIRIAREHLGDDAQVRLFGSRLDDSARGGDVDLFVEASRRPTLLQRARVKLALERALGLPVDIIAVGRGDPGTPFERLARDRSRPLDQDTP
jgi:predicted nucleotidyltransferase